MSQRQKQYLWFRFVVSSVSLQVWSDLVLISYTTCKKENYGTLVCIVKLMTLNEVILKRDTKVNDCMEDSNRNVSF